MHNAGRNQHQQLKDTTMKNLILALLILTGMVHAQSLIVISGSKTVGNPTSGTPTFSPGAGSYSSTQSVTISATGGSVICYNTTGSPATNGTTGCTTGTLYSGAVSVSTSETLYAVSGGTGYTDSAVGSATYTITAVNYMITNVATSQGSLRTDTAYNGYQFQANTVTIKQICRGYVSGNSGTHNVSLLTASSIVAEVAINTSTAPVVSNTGGQLFQCSSTTIAGTLPVTLTSGTIYQVLSCEGGDQWRDIAAFLFDSTFANTSAGYIYAAYGTSCTAFGTSGGGGSANSAWVPTNLTR
jgi:hypothetical protein